MKKTLIYGALSLVLNGCGAVSNDSSGSLDSGSMELNKKYIMHNGDEVIKDSPNSTLKVIHKNNKLFSTIELLSGKAIIFRK